MYADDEPHTMWAWNPLSKTVNCKSNTFINEVVQVRGLTRHFHHHANL